MEEKRQFGRKIFLKNKVVGIKKIQDLQKQAMRQISLKRTAVDCSSPPNKSEY
jgi:hypothetical protein